MGWKLKTLGGAPKPTVQTVHRRPKVYRDHLAILRSVQAPDDVIKIAEEVAAENTAPQAEAQRR
jgi:hypothetical protein